MCDGQWDLVIIARRGFRGHQLNSINTAQFTVTSRRLIYIACAKGLILSDVITKYPANVFLSDRWDQQFDETFSQAEVCPFENFTQSLPRLRNAVVKLQPQCCSHCRAVFTCLFRRKEPNIVLAYLGVSDYCSYVCERKVCIYHLELLTDQYHGGRVSIVRRSSGEFPKRWILTLASVFWSKIKTSFSNF